MVGFEERKEKYFLEFKLNNPSKKILNLAIVHTFGEQWPKAISPFLIRLVRKRNHLLPCLKLS